MSNEDIAERIAQILPTLSQDKAESVLKYAEFQHQRQNGQVDYSDSWSEEDKRDLLRAVGDRLDEVAPWDGELPAPKSQKM